jgi:hypothetical protein
VRRWIFGVAATFCVTAAIAVPLLPATSSSGTLPYADVVQFVPPAEQACRKRAINEWLRLHPYQGKPRAVAAPLGRVLRAYGCRWP